MKHYYKRFHVEHFSFLFSILFLSATEILCLDVYANTIDCLKKKFSYDIVFMKIAELFHVEQKNVFYKQKL